MCDIPNIAKTTAWASRWLLAVLFIGSFLMPDSAFAACNWSNVRSGSIDTSSGLYSAAAISTDDAWAVGSGYFPDVGNSDQTLTEHWDGRRWNVVPSANENTVEVLIGVAAISKNDVWAVGWRYFGGPIKGLIERWNGARWKVVANPNPSSGVNLSGVAAVSASDVWAVGSSGNNTLTEHWDGANWTVVPSPNPIGGNSVLSSVSAVSKNDVWAVGENLTNAGQLSLIEHWNGSRWTIVPSPTSFSVEPFPHNNLQSVAARSASDVWAVGTYSFLYARGQTLTEHWDGNSWKVVPSPNPSPNQNGSGLMSVVAISGTDAWAVGNYVDSLGNYQALTEHWDGVRWTIIPTPGELYSSTSLLGLAALGPNDILSVGSMGDVNTWNTLALQFHC